MQRAQEIYEQYLDRMVGDETALARSRSVADFDAEETDCPACGTRFKTAGTTECPDCGIRFK